MSSVADDQEQEQLAEGTLISHLIELRSRIMKSMLAVLIVFLCLVPFAQDIFQIVSEPLRSVLPEGQTMIATRVASPFLTPFMTTLLVALVTAMPVRLYQVWEYVAPGHYRRERRLALPVAIARVVLFHAGVAFAEFVVFPVMFSFFAMSAPEGVAMNTDIGEYLSFVLTLFLAFGISFEVPIATVMLIWSGLVSVEKLKA